MNHYLTQQRILIAKSYFQNSESSIVTIYKLHPSLRNPHVPSASTVKRIMEKLEGTGLITDIRPATRIQQHHSVENIRDVRQNVAEHPFGSVFKK
ncbi:hypothetical protein Trydic_g516 [Trypoxylus dichotomus]